LTLLARQSGRQGECDLPAKGIPTEQVWIFDARSNVPGITKKDLAPTKEHFAEFEKCYGKDPNGLSKRKDLGEEGRFRSFSIQQVKEKSYKLVEFAWLKDDSLEDGADLPELRINSPFRPFAGLDAGLRGIETSRPSARSQYLVRSVGRPPVL
jgi:hypothetical protein